ncbi:protein S100-A16 [Pogona vitticeps]|uniref:Protein S100-A16-like n=1 Tax=Pogona vitticeps TaxID=103695 RepID=A0A6J0V0G6_9SAUR|nr:protein S100-A16-like [Pogona vitticeps]
MGEPSELESAIETLVKTYDKHAERGLAFWQERRIRKKAFRKMLNQELNHMLTGTQYKSAADKLFEERDDDGDGALSFDEYWDLIGDIADVCARLKQQEVESGK